MKNIKSVKTLPEEYFSIVNPKATNLDSEKTDVFHVKIAKALFICKRESTDIQTTVQF